VLSTTGSKLDDSILRRLQRVIDLAMKCRDRVEDYHDKVLFSVDGELEYVQT
jgi:hypothetical protein